MPVDGYDPNTRYEHPSWITRTSGPMHCTCGAEVLLHVLGDSPNSPSRLIDVALGGVHDCTPRPASMQDVAEQLAGLFRPAVQEMDGRPRISQGAIERRTEPGRAPSPVRPGTQRKFRPMQALDG